MVPFHVSGPSRNAEGRLPEAGLEMPPWLELSELVMEVDPEPNGGLAATSCEAGGAGIHSKRGVADVR